MRLDNLRRGIECRLPAVLLALSAPCVASGQTYTISTFAGGRLPVNIPGTSASIYNPQGVAVDKSGNVFFTDNDTILRLDAVTHVVTLVAGNGTYGSSGDGGPATSAQLEPYSIAVDSAGNLYIGDGSTGIRTVSNGVITTVAANARVNFGSHGAIAIDSAGNIFTSTGLSVQKISNGVVTTVAGNGTQGYSGDNGPATSAQFNNAGGIAVDAAGDLYIADTYNYRIRKVSNGVIATVAGNGVLGFVSSVPAPGIGDGGPATSAELDTPTDVAVDAAGNLYIADHGRIRKVSNGVITTVAGGGAPPADPYGNLLSIGDGGPATSAAEGAFAITVDSAGNLFLADGEFNRIREVSGGVINSVAGNGTVGDGGPPTNVELNNPFVVSVDASRNVYFLDGNCGVRKVSGGVISTVAGGLDRCGYNGDDIPVASAWVSAVNVAADAAGNLFIPEGSSCRIRKVSNGVVTTVAGAVPYPVCGYSGDGGPAVSAQLNNPTGLAVDPAGNLYIADRYNNRIRELSNGVITTVAGNGAAGYNGDGGPATGAQLSGPSAVALDGAGNLYILDSGNNCIRQVVNGVISTVVAGMPGGSSPLAHLSGFAVDAAGNLYAAGVTVIGYGLVQRIAGGVSTTIAGGGPGPGSGIGDGGPATLAELAQPGGVAVDSSGNVYVADQWDNRIRALTPNAAGSQFITFAPLPDVVIGIQPFTITATASSGLTVTFGSVTPSVCTVAGSRVTLVAPGTCSITASQPGNATYSAATPVTQTFTVSAPPVISALTPNSALAGGPAFSLTVTGSGFTAGAVVEWNGNSLTTSDSGANQLTAAVPASLIASPGGAYVTVQVNGVPSNIFTFVITSANGLGGIIITVAGGAGTGTVSFSGDGGPATAAALEFPAGVAVDASGNIYIADTFNNRIRKVSVGGIITTVAGNGNQGFSGDGGPATSASLSKPIGVAVDVSGNLYISDQYNNRIRRVSTSGIITTVAGSGNVGVVNSTVTGGFGGDGGPATSALLNFPWGVAVDASGNLFIADGGGNDRVRKVSANGIITTVAGNGTYGFSGDGGPATSALLAAPWGVAVDASGNLYISDAANNDLRKVSSDGIITTIAGNQTAGFSGDGGPATAAELSNPFGIAADASGNIYIADEMNDRIRKVSPDGIITTFAGTGGACFPCSASALGDGGPATSALVEAQGVAVDGSGNVFIADGTHNRTREVFALTNQSQTITFNPLSPVNLGAAPFILTATASSGLPLTFVSTTQAVCTVSGSTVTIVATGTCSITASQPGNANYLAATPVTQTFIVNPRLPTLGITSSASASYQGGVAPGSLISIYGANLAIATSNGFSLPLPISFSGTSVTVNGVLSPLLYVGPSQINAQVPPNTAVGPATVVVSGNGVGGLGTVNVLAAAPGLFADGSGRAAAQHSDGSFVTTASPASSGEYVTFYGTGQGPLNLTPAAGAAAGFGASLSSCLDTVTVTMNGLISTGQYNFCGLASGFVGLTQINASIPAGLPAGDVPVVVTINGVSSLPAVLAVSGN